MKLDIQIIFGNLYRYTLKTVPEKCIKHEPATSIGMISSEMRELTSTKKDSFHYFKNRHLGGTKYKYRNIFLRVFTRVFAY